jgi:hypothetical protein
MIQEGCLQEDQVAPRKACLKGVFLHSTKAPMRIEGSTEGTRLSTLILHNFNDRVCNITASKTGNLQKTF